MPAASATMRVQPASVLTVSARGANLGMLGLSLGLAGLSAYNCLIAMTGLMLLSLALLSGMAVFYLLRSFPDSTIPGAHSLRQLIARHPARALAIPVMLTLAWAVLILYGASAI